MDLLVVGAGTALILGMMLFMLRRAPILVTAGPDGLLVGHRAVGWADVLGLDVVRGQLGQRFRVHTGDGVVAFCGEQVVDAPDAVRRAIVERSGLEPVPGARPPEGETVFVGDEYREWARAELLVAPEPEPEAAPPRDNKTRAAVGFGLLALLAKFGKFGVFGLQWLGKGLKLGKLLPTALSMLVTVWAYAQLWEWWFALGFALLIMVHELGHAAVIAAKGLRTSPIVFVPFVGAFIAMKDQFRDAATEAEVGFGGPAVGALAATACFLVWRATGHAFFLHLAYVGFFLNLFNLLPLSPLDGGRIVTAISTWLWVVGLLGAGALAVATGHPILLIVVVLGAFRALAVWRQRRAGRVPAYFEVPAGYRALMALGYFGLCGYLGFMTHRSLVLAGAL